MYTANSRIDDTIHVSDNFYEIKDSHILFIGFDKPIERCFTDGLSFEVSTFIDTRHDLEESINWLLLTTRRSKNKVAIVVDAQWSLKNSNQLIHFVTRSSVLKYLPLLVISNRSNVKQESEFIRIGVDDCYIHPVDWNVMMDRIKGLWAFKPQLLEYRSKPLEQYRPNKRAPIPPIKRIMDVGLSLMLIMVLSPVFILAMLAIRIESRGPVFYCSKRAGRNYRNFNFWKFRSMYVDADTRLNELKAQNQYGASATFIKLKNDPRVTRVGRMIRKYSIDELPQLFNILVGDMSLVGNRPLPLYEAEQLLSDAYSDRFMAPAGLTGLWQVSKRGHEDMSTEERIALDVQYAHSRSLLMDIKILFKTFTSFIQKENV